MDAYRGFAGIYDLLMDDFDYSAWANYYIDLIARTGAPVQNICECACGTGSLTMHFAKKGLRVTGVDISREMLELAADKVRQNGVQVQLVCQDMARLSLPRPVDAVICGCDGVNYLTSDKRVRAFFDAAHAALRPGGVLAIDISSAYKLKCVMGDHFFAEERDEAAYIWQNSLNGDILDMDLTFFIREDGDLYRRVTEHHRQRAHEWPALVHLLQEAGFSDIRVYGDQTFADPGAEEMRIHFCAVRK